MLNVNSIIQRKFIQPTNNATPPSINPYLKQKMGKDTFERSDIQINDEMKKKFDEFDLARLAKNPQKLKNAEYLSQTQLKSENIAQNLLYHFDENLDGKALSEKVLNLQNSCKDNLDKIEFSKNSYDANEITLEATLKNGSKKVEVYNKNLAKEFSENISYQKSNKKEYEIIKSKDYRSNTISKTRSLVVDGWKTPVSEVIVKLDKNNKVQYKEMSETSDVEGIMNTKRIYPNGEIKTVSVAHINPKNNVVTIKKDMQSPDGTRTQYNYLDDPQGNRVVEYKITDKDGKILLNNKEFFDVISENKFISSKNGNDYEILVDKNQLNVKDLKTQKSSQLNLGSYLMNNEKTLLNLLKQVDGEELMQMKDNVTRLFLTNDNAGASNYHMTRKDVTTVDNLYTMLHEFGHAKDMKNYDDSSFKTRDLTSNTMISKNKDILETYNIERNNFNKTYPDAQRHHIDYFIKNTHRNGKDGSFAEAVAEINALLNTHNSVDRFSMRAQYLQQNFPKTIAQLAKVLN